VFRSIPQYAVLFFFPYFTAAHIWALSSSVLRFLNHSQLDAWWDSSGQVISPLQRPLPIQDNTKCKCKTNICALSGIRTRNPSNNASADLWLRPRSHWPILFNSAMNKASVTCCSLYYHGSMTEVLIEIDQCHLYKRISVIRFKCCKEQKYALSLESICHTKIVKYEISLFLFLCTFQKSPFLYAISFFLPPPTPVLLCGFITTWKSSIQCEGAG
jgi:hypothetical protein